MMKDFLLTIDKGNTRSKYRLYKTLSGHFDDFAQEGVQSLIDGHKLHQDNTDIIYSNVGSELESIQNFSSIDASTFLKEKFFLDMPLFYTQTIGIDRIVQSYFLYKNLNLEQPVLLIDSGTYTTVDIISSHGFEGGLILPGIDITLKSYQYAHQLPVYSKDDFFQFLKLQEEDLLGHSTKEAILKGVYHLILSPIEKIQSKYQPQDIVLTGGCADFYSHILKKKTNLDLIFRSLFYLYQKEFIQ